MKRKPSNVANDAGKPHFVTSGTFTTIFPGQYVDGACFVQTIQADPARAKCLMSWYDESRHTINESEMDVPKSGFVRDNTSVLQQLASARIADVAHSVFASVSCMVVIASLLLHVLRN